MSDVVTTSHASPAPRVYRQGGAARGLFQPRTFNKRTRQRFVYDRMCELIAHLGRDPSYPERILIGRIAANEWDLRKLDARLDDGEEMCATTRSAALFGATGKSERA